MKITQKLLLGFGLMASFQSNAQTSNFLKEYKAPDFKYRQLTFSLLGNGNGNKFNGFATHGLNLLGDINYLQYANSSKYQGMLEIGTMNDLQITNAGGTFYQYDGNHEVTTENRFYIKPKWFLGAHSNASFMTSSFKAGNAPSFDTKMLFVSQIVSTGFGRLEPVSFARSAMDIEFLLSKTSSMKRNFSDEELTKLADKITEVQNKRFYDIRLGRIYQLEAIDSIIEGFDIVKKKDMAYFSRLQDSYLYGRFNERTSGVRHELGYNQLATFHDGGTNPPDVFGGYLFYKFMANIPQSYKFQHNVDAEFIAGVESQNPRIWLSGRYEFGYYPNTRTELKVGARLTALTYEDGPAAYGEVYGNLGYYISPKFRASVSGSFYVADNYINHGLDQIVPSNFVHPLTEYNYQMVLSINYALF